MQQSEKRSQDASERPRHHDGILFKKIHTWKNKKSGIYDIRVKVVKHSFQNLKSCNVDNEGHTKTSREG